MESDTEICMESGNNKVDENSGARDRMISDLSDLPFMELVIEDKRVVVCYSIELEWYLKSSPDKNIKTSLDQFRGDLKDLEPFVHDLCNPLNIQMIFFDTSVGFDCLHAVIYQKQITHINIQLKAILFRILAHVKLEGASMALFDSSNIGETVSIKSNLLFYHFDYYSIEGDADIMLSDGDYKLVEIVDSNIRLISLNMDNGGNLIDIPNPSINIALALINILPSEICNITDEYYLDLWKNASVYYKLGRFFDIFKTRIIPQLINQFPYYAYNQSLLKWNRTIALFEYLTDYQLSVCIGNNINFEKLLFKKDGRIIELREIKLGMEQSVDCIDRFLTIKYYLLNKLGMVSTLVFTDCGEFNNLYYELGLVGLNEKYNSIFEDKVNSILNNLPTIIEESSNYISKRMFLEGQINAIISGNESSSESYLKVRDDTVIVVHYIYNPTYNEEYSAKISFGDVKSLASLLSRAHKEGTKYLKPDESFRENINILRLSETIRTMANCNYDYGGDIVASESECISLLSQDNVNKSYIIIAEINHVSYIWNINRD